MLTDDNSPYLVEIAIEARSPDDRARLADAIEFLVRTEKTRRIMVDPESGQTIISGQSAPQLEHIIDRLKNEFGVACEVGQPHVAYRETLGRAATVQHVHRRSSGEPSEHAAVTIRFEPVDMSSDFEFVSAPASGAIAPDIAAAVEGGVRSAAESGLVAGFPMIGVKATLLGAEARDNEASATAFETAGRAAFRLAKSETAPQLLEPIMQVVVTCPHTDHEAVLSDIRSRRGNVGAVDRQFDQTSITAEVPLANLLDYEHALDIALEGRARAEMRFLRYAPIPNAPAPPDDNFPAAAALRA
jgi:elongation factor G